MALSGTFTVTYTRARIDVQSGRPPFDRGITSVASRDVRLLIVMVGGLLGQGLVTLVVLAVLTNPIMLLRLLAAHRILKIDIYRDGQGPCPVFICSEPLKREQPQ